MKAFQSIKCWMTVNCDGKGRNVRREEELQYYRHWPSIHKDAPHHKFLSFLYSPHVWNEPKIAFFPCRSGCGPCRGMKVSGCMQGPKIQSKIKCIGLEIWKLDEKFYWNFWFQSYAEVRQGLLLTFKGLLEPWYSNPVFNSLKSDLIPNFIKIRPHLAKWEHFEV